MGESHAAQDVRRFGELNIVVTDDLDAIAPGIAEVEKWSRKRFDACVGECLARGFLVVDDEPEVTSVVGGLHAPALQRDELVSQVDERHRRTLAAKRELEQASVKRQRRFYVTDLE